MEILKNYIFLFLYWGVSFIIAFLVVYYNCPGYKNYIGTPFQFTFIGVLLGFSLTLFNHIVNQIEKKQNQLQNQSQNQSQNQLEDNQNNEQKNYNKDITEIKHLCAEIKDDVRFLFYSLIIIVIISIVSQPIKIKMYTLISANIYVLLPTIKEAFLLSIFFLCLFSVWDLVNVSLKLSSQVVIGNNKEKKD